MTKTISSKTQPKTVGTQSQQRPFRPEIADAPPARTMPSAPRPYRPQAVPKALQTKMSAAQQSLDQSARAPSAPPVYRSQALPRVLQTKKTAAQQLPAGQAAARRIIPTVYRPQAPRIAPPIQCSFGVSPKAKKNRKKKKNIASGTEKEGMGSVKCGSKTWDCHHISYAPQAETGGYISANFNPVGAPSRAQLPVDSICDITIATTVYQATLYQLDINSVHFTRGNFTNVTVKSA